MKIVEVRLQEFASLGVTFVRTTVVIDGVWAWEYDEYGVHADADSYNPPGFGSDNEKQAAAKVFMAIQGLSVAEHEPPVKPDGTANAEA